jgi:hypothetical protein
MGEGFPDPAGVDAFLPVYLRVANCNASNPGFFSLGHGHKIMLAVSCCREQELHICDTLRHRIPFVFAV